MCHSHNIRPVERACICPQAARGFAHTSACNDAFRARFFGAWRSTRMEFYAAAADQPVLDARRSMN